jgi:sugar lactone lactonase YvrE
LALVPLLLAGCQTTTGSTAGNVGFLVSDASNDRIVEFKDFLGNGWSALGATGTGTNQFSFPEGIWRDAQGHIYVADSGNNRIVRVDDINGTNWTTFGTAGSGNGQLSGPTSVAVDGNGKIYIADNGNKRIVRIDDMSGSNWLTYTSAGSLASATGIFVDDRTRIYFVDFVAGHLFRVNDMTGAGEVRLGDLGGQVRFVSVDGQERPYIANFTVAMRIVRYSNMAGDDKTSFGQTGPGVNQFNNPATVAFDSAGRIYVTDTGNQRVVRIDDFNGTNWTTFGSAGSGINEFNGPRGLVVYGY